MREVRKLHPCLLVCDILFPCVVRRFLRGLPLARTNKKACFLLANRQKNYIIVLILHCSHILSRSRVLT